MPPAMISRGMFCYYYLIARLITLKRAPNHKHMQKSHYIPMLPIDVLKRLFYATCRDNSIDDKHDLTL